jgi:hypothetical protein
MEMIAPKTTQKLSGFCLLVFLLLMYGDQVTVVSSYQQTVVSKSIVSDPL